MTIQAPSISTNRNTNVAIEMVRQRAIETEKVWHEMNPGCEDQDELDMDFAAYCLLSDQLRHHNLSEGVVNELIRLYPDKADDAEQSYYEWKHDI